MSYYRDQLELWLKQLDVKADIVYDVGGGQGNVKGRTKSWEVEKYRVLDLPDYDIDTQHRTTYKQADVVFCLEVFEYLINPVVALSNIRYLLKDGGKAYVTFAFVYPLHEETNLDSLRYTETGVNRMVQRLKMKVTNIWYRIDKSGLLQTFYASDGMHPAKGYQHHNATGFIIEVTK